MGGAASVAGPLSELPEVNAMENRMGSRAKIAAATQSPTVLSMMLAIFGAVGEAEQESQLQGEKCDAMEGNPTHSSKLRASVLLMAKLINDAVPNFCSYRIEDPSKEELNLAGLARQSLSSPESYLEFYATTYKFLHAAGSDVLPFSNKPIAFRNAFLLELMRLIVFEGSHRATFSERVRHFGNKHVADGVAIQDYGLIGEALLRGMKSVEEQGRGPPCPESLWPKVYSRFLRSLVPAMIMAEAGSPCVLSPRQEGSEGTGEGMGTGASAEGEGQGEGASMTDSNLGMLSASSEQAFALAHLPAAAAVMAQQELF